MTVSGKAISAMRFISCNKKIKRRVGICWWIVSLASPLSCRLALRSASQPWCQTSPTYGLGLHLNWEIVEVSIGPHVVEVGSVDVHDGVNSQPESSNEDVHVGVSIPELAETPGGSVKNNAGQSSLEMEGVVCWHCHFVVTDVLAWEAEVDDKALPPVGAPTCFSGNFWVALFQVNRRSGCPTILQ